MKKIILSVILCLAIFTSSSVAFAEQYAYSIGTEYTDIDTSDDAETAAKYFGAAGYDSYYNTAPTVYYMRGDNPNTNKPRMESEILFFSGHGNQSCVAFNYKGKGGDYATGVYDGEDYNSSTGYKYAGIESYDLSNVKLMVFAACKTSKGSDNITNHSYQALANTTVGWYKSVGSSSHSRWLKRFTYRLSKGDTVEEAADYANSFYYTDEDVKSSEIEGDEDLVIDISSSKSLAELDEAKQYKDETHAPILSQSFINEMKQEDNKSREYILKKDKMKLGNLSSKNSHNILNSYMQNNIDPLFDINNYKIVVTNRNEDRDNSSVIDFVYTIDGIETNSGYTVFTENGICTKLYDNTIKGKTIDKVAINNAKKTINTKGIKEKALKLVPDEWKVLEIKEKPYYDMNTGKLYYIVRTELMLKGDNLLKVLEYKYEVK